MCIVIDTCVIASLLDVNNSNHHNLAPVLQRLKEGRVVAVYGGKKYLQEILNMHKYLQYFVELKRAGRFVEIDHAKVDALEEKLIKYVSHSDFDDAHLIAIITVSHCRLVCTDDKRAVKFLTDKRLYPKGFKDIKVYRHKEQERMLLDKRLHC